jgi:hypothetical protein
VLRVVFAVALAVVIVAAVTPAIDDARERRSAAAVVEGAATVERAAVSLLATDEHTRGAGARRGVTVRLPARSPTNAGVAYVSVGGPPDAPGEVRRRGEVVYQVVGGEPRRITLDVPLYTPDGPVVLRGDGDRRLQLRVTRVDGRRVVVVRHG